MKINDEIIYLTIFLVLNVFLASGIFKDIKQLITKNDIYDNLQYYARWTFPGVALCIGGILALIRLIIILIGYLF